VSRVPVLTIDGPSGAGKGTISRLIAVRSGWHLLDSGALYRLVALAGARAYNWKSFLAAFLLFRLFDIWKPAPVRQLEALPGGIGINADDAMAGIYAALVLLAAGCFNLY